MVLEYDLFVTLSCLQRRKSSSLCHPLSVCYSIAHSFVSYVCRLFLLFWLESAEEPSINLSHSTQQLIDRVTYVMHYKHCDYYSFVL